MMDGDLLDLLQQTNIPSSVVEALQQIGVTTVPRLHDLTRDDIEGIMNEGDPAIRPVAARVQAQLLHQATARVFTETRPQSEASPQAPVTSRTGSLSTPDDIIPPWPHSRNIMVSERNTSSEAESAEVSERLRETERALEGERANHATDHERAEVALAEVSERLREANEYKSALEGQLRESRSEYAAELARLRRELAQSEERIRSAAELEVELRRDKATAEASATQLRGNLTTLRGDLQNRNIEISQLRLSLSARN